jgi:tetratricopeptide (TPR) repeat protein
MNKSNDMCLGFLLALFCALFLFAPWMVSPAIAVNRKQESKQLLSLAKSAVQRHDYEKALSYLHTAEKDDPQSGEVQLLLGESNFYMEDNDAAIRHFSNGFRLLPDWQEQQQYVLYGQALVLAGKNKEAVDVFSKGLNKIPRSQALFCERGSTYALLNQGEKAIADLTAAVAIDEKNAYFLEQRARIYSNLHHFENAVKDYTAAIKLTPGAAMLYAHRANVYQKMGKLDLVQKDRATCARLSAVDPRGPK